MATNGSDRERAIWNRIASRYDRIIPWFGSRYEAVRSRLRRDLEGVPRVLELAAGTGQFTLDIAATVDQLVATDLAPSMIERLRERMTSAGVGNVEVREMSAEAIAFDDGTFDAVVCANLLHVMEQPQLALQEIMRVLKPGGLLIAPTFCHGQTLRARTTSSLLSLISPFVAHTRFSGDTLAEFVRNNGFSIDAMENLGGWLPEIYLRSSTPC